jgi:hypothetical protein
MKQGKEVNEMRVPFMRHMAWYLVIVMFIIGIAPRLDAALVESEITSLTHVDRTADLEKIQNVLETQDEIQNRLTQLSDQQIHQVATKLDDLKIGGDGLGILIAVLVVAILVIVILQLTGHKVVVT